MDKKYQVFISSTYEDLKEERIETAKTVLQLDCIPAGMEYFCSSSEEQFNVIKQIIDLCDYYILIVGNRYGSIHRELKKSFTELEYEYALSKNIPILVFIKKDNNPDPKEKHVNEFMNFKEKVSSNRVVTFWSTKEELSKNIAISLSKEIFKNGRVGWVKTDVIDVERTTFEKTKAENANLLEEIDNLKSELSKAKKELESITTTNQNLNYDQAPIMFNYYVHGGRASKSKTIKDIFKDVSINMINVSVSERLFKEYIGKAIDEFNYSHINEIDLKKICNQLIALNLVYTKFDDKKGALFYYLTKKGEKIRDELNLYVI